MAKPEKRERARELRKRGWSVTAIVEELDVSKGSVSAWVRDIELTPDQQAVLKANKVRWGAQNKGAKTNRENALKQRKAYQQAGRERARNGSRLHQVGCMLYWAEGTKAKKNHLHFANSDPYMIKLFVHFLREELDVNNNLIHLQIHCHTNELEEVRRIEQYWLDLLGLTPAALDQTRYKEGTSSRKNRLPNGVCAVQVHRTEILHHILGAIQEYGGFENDDWLF